MGRSVKVDVDLVLVPVTVTDQRGHLVIGLQKDSFNILDQSEQEVIRHFSSEDAPISESSGVCSRYWSRLPVVVD
jgi:Ca-activated chloride channel homolog